MKQNILIALITVLMLTGNIYTANGAAKMIKEIRANLIKKERCG